jgi:hypothetical protein
MREIRNASKILAGSLNRKFLRAESAGQVGETRDAYRILVGSLNKRLLRAGNVGHVGK